MGKVASYFELQALEAEIDMHIDNQIKEAKAQSKAQAKRKKLEDDNECINSVNTTILLDCMPEEVIKINNKRRQGLIYQSFCPYRHKYELVDWAFSYFKGTPKSKYQRMSRKQLYAIWFKVQRDNQQRTT